MAVSQSLTLSQNGQNVAANTSQLRILWTSTQTGESHNDNIRTAKYYVSVNGGAETEYQITYTLPLQTTKTILDVTITVKHNNEGKCAVTVRTWMDTRISAGEVELSKSLTMTDIARASTIGATAADIGAVSMIAVGRKSTAYTHSISYRFGSLSGYITEDGGVSPLEVKYTAASIPFAVPDDFYGEIPNAKTGKCSLTCRTYSGSTLIGTTTASFTVTASAEACAPSITGTVTDVNPDTVVLTGDDGKLVQYMSTALCTITADAKHGASITSKKINYQDVDGSLTIENAAIGMIRFSAFDSRGYSADLIVRKDMIPYVKLTCNAVGSRTDPTSGNAVLTISGNYFNGSFGASDNSLSVRYRVGSGDYISLAPTITENTYSASVDLSGLDYNQEHTITVIAEDKLDDVEVPVKILRGIPVFDWGQNDFTFHVMVNLLAGAKGVAPEGLCSDVKYIDTWDGLNALVENTVSTMEIHTAKIISVRCALSDPYGAGMLTLFKGTDDDMFECAFANLHVTDGTSMQRNGYAEGGAWTWGDWESQNGSVSALAAYPVGSIYMSVNNTSPATLFGGTWVRIQDRFLLAAGSSYSAGSTGGEETHTLSKNEMPAHTHTFTGTAASHTHDTFLRDANAADYASYRYMVDTYGTGAAANGWAPTMSASTSKKRMRTGSASHTPSGTNANTGGGEAHNNMPPYLAVYVWKRTA